MHLLTRLILVAFKLMQSTAIDGGRTPSNAVDDVWCVRTWRQAHSIARFQ